MRGNAIITQSGGPTAVINASVVGIIGAAKKSKKILKIYGASHGTLGVLKEELFDLNKESLKTLQRLKLTPSSALGSCRYKIQERDLERIFEVIKAHRIHYYFVIGGNDSMDTANEISKIAGNKDYPLVTIGIPKTIDNDLIYTDHCPGYGSVIRWLAIATRDAGLDTESLCPNEPVKVIETMGRDSGWVTAGTALAKERPEDAPHLVYLPEIAFNKDKFLKDVSRVYKMLGRCVITVCEGLRDKSGKTLVESKAGVEKDGFGHAQRGGVSKYLCDLIIQDLGIKARWDKPGTIQRVSEVCVSKVDLKEAELVGKAGVKAALKGRSNIMITLKRQSSKPYKCGVGEIALNRVANKKKTVPRDFINQRGNYVSKKFINWARPLIGGPLPCYTRLKKIFVKKLLKSHHF